MLARKLVAVAMGEVPSIYAKGGKGSAPAPIATPPPIAPPPPNVATMEQATDENEKTNRKAQALGAKSLAIPLGTIGSSTLNL